MAQQFDLRKPEHYAMFAMHNVDEQFIGLCDQLIAIGTEEADPERTDDTWLTLIGVGFQLQNTLIAFPAPLSARKNWRAAVDEICWMARGETNINTLNSKIWDEWSDEDGECGPIYGAQWRRWLDLKAFHDVTGKGDSGLSADASRIRDEILRMREDGYLETPMADGRILFEGQIDQLANALNQIRARSRSRRIRVQAFNPAYLNMMGLPPCHTEFEFNVTKATAYEQAQVTARDGEASEDSLHLTVTMRSNDAALGRSFNIIGYSALHQLIAKWAGMNVGGFTLNTTNTHLYTHHVEGYKQQRAQWMELRKQMQETGQPVQYPVLDILDHVVELDAVELLDNMSVEWFDLVDYSPKPAVKFRVTK